MIVEQMSAVPFGSAVGDYDLLHLMEDLYQQEPSVRHHTPPTLTPSSYGSVLQKRARRLSEEQPGDRRLRLAAELETTGMLTTTQKSSLRARLLAGDPEVVSALDRYDVGDSSELERVLHDVGLERDVLPQEKKKPSFSSSSSSQQGGQQKVGSSRPAALREQQQPAANPKEGTTTFSSSPTSASSSSSSSSNQSSNQEAPPQRQQRSATTAVVTPGAPPNPPKKRQQSPPPTKSRVRAASIDLLAELDLDDGPLSDVPSGKPPPSAECLGLPHDDQLMGFEMEMPFLPFGGPASPGAAVVVATNFPAQAQAQQSRHGLNSTASSYYDLPPASRVVVQHQHQHHRKDDPPPSPSGSAASASSAHRGGRWLENNEHHRFGGKTAPGREENPGLLRRRGGDDQQEKGRHNAPATTTSSKMRRSSSAGVHHFGNYGGGGRRGGDEGGHDHHKNHLQDQDRDDHGDTKKRPVSSPSTTTTTTSHHHHHHPRDHRPLHDHYDPLRGASLSLSFAPAVAYEGKVSSTVAVPPAASELNPGQAPPYETLVNFPRAKSRARIHCVMCGRYPRCSPDDLDHAPRDDNAAGGLDASSPGGVVVIPRQNKDVCRDCDKALWRHNDSDTYFKWCKGCKRFRNLTAFAEKLAASKCDRCRERGRQGYVRRKNDKISTGGPDEL